MQPYQIVFSNGSAPSVPQLLTGDLKTVMLTPAVYPHFIEFLHIDIRALGKNRIEITGDVIEWKSTGGWICVSMRRFQCEYGF